MSKNCQLTNYINIKLTESIGFVLVEALVLALPFGMLDVDGPRPLGIFDVDAPCPLGILDVERILLSLLTPGTPNASFAAVC